MWLLAPHPPAPRASIRRTLLGCRLSLPGSPHVITSHSPHRTMSNGALVA